MANRYNILLDEAVHTQAKASCGGNFTEAVKRGLKLYLFYSKTVESGGKLLMETKEGEQKEVVLI